MHRQRKITHAHSLNRYVICDVCTVCPRGLHGTATGGTEQQAALVQEQLQAMLAEAEQREAELRAQAAAEEASLQRLRREAEAADAEAAG